jgi:hypothetical protein
MNLLRRDLFQSSRNRRIDRRRLDRIAHSPIRRSRLLGSRHPREQQNLGKNNRRNSHAAKAENELSFNNHDNLPLVETKRYNNRKLDVLAWAR